MAAPRHFLFLLLPMLHQEISGPTKAGKEESTEEAIKERVAPKVARKEKTKSRPLL